MARILIVDDEESDLLLGRTILERAGHDTHVAVNGAEALRDYVRKGIEIVVTDLEMPEGHGLEGRRGGA